ncbi:hypothetical protein B0H10DRAFT_2185180 [Mycena sp. CBHHK59/15]|nr:hypothetical protein B0H10DRAFT_2185180 [Mycena sp. CBHHK59/15]
MSSSSFDLPSGPLPVFRSISGPLPVFRFISGPPLVDPRTSGQPLVALLCHSGPSLISAPPQTVAHPSELCYIMMPDGGICILTCFPFLLKLLNDPGVITFDDDTTYKWVEGEMNEWELTIFAKVVLHAASVVRVYINRASTDFFEKVFDELQHIKLLVIGICRSVMKHNVPEYSLIPNDMPPEKVVLKFIKICWRHSKEPVHDFRLLVSNAKYDRLLDFVYIDSKETLDAFSAFVKHLGVKKIQDWWAHKEMHEWIIPCLVKSQSLIPADVWDSTPLTMNTNELEGQLAKELEGCHQSSAHTKDLNERLKVVKGASKKGKSSGSSITLSASSSACVKTTTRKLACTLSLRKSDHGLAVGTALVDTTQPQEFKMSTFESTEPDLKAVGQEDETLAEAERHRGQIFQTRMNAGKQKRAHLTAPSWKTITDGSPSHALTTESLNHLRQTTNSSLGYFMQELLDVMNRTWETGASCSLRRYCSHPDPVVHITESVYGRNVILRWHKNTNVPNSMDGTVGEFFDLHLVNSSSAVSLRKYHNGGTLREGKRCVSNFTLTLLGMWLGTIILLQILENVHVPPMLPCLPHRSRECGSHQIKTSSFRSGETVVSLRATSVTIGEDGIVVIDWKTGKTMQDTGHGVDQVSVDENATELQREMVRLSQGDWFLKWFYK